MKNFKLLFIAALFMIFFSGSVFAQKQKTVETVTVKTAIYCDHCKVCETCGPKFEKTLLKEKGIQMVTLDEAAMTIKIVYNTKKTNLSTIKEAISKLGYDADDIRADATAYEGLDGCCKKF